MQNAGIAPLLSSVRGIKAPFTGVGELRIENESCKARPFQNQILQWRGLGFRVYQVL